MNTQTIKIQGHSDDVLNVYYSDALDKKTKSADEFYPSTDKPLSIIVTDLNTFDVVVVTAQYGIREGVWTIGVEPLDEDKPMPKMSIEMAKNGYSPLLVIECSDNVIVMQL